MTKRVSPQDLARSFFFSGRFVSFFFVLVIVFTLLAGKRRLRNKEGLVYLIFD